MWSFTGESAMFCAKSCLDDFRSVDSALPKRVKLMTVSSKFLTQLINGFGTSILNTTVPVWAMESVPHTGRGQFIAIEFRLNIFSEIMAYWLEP